MPWTHLHMWPNGNAYMCCVSDSAVRLGVVSEKTSIADVWNSDRMKENRLKMLRDEPVSECQRCYEIEKSGGLSQRLDHNRAFSHHMDFVKTTKLDGTVEKVNMPYMDLRFSNICNLRCRTCGPELSSKWFNDAKKIGNISDPNAIAIQMPSADPEVLWKYLEEIIDSAEIIYFAGGEPIFMEEHYRLLKLLLARNKTDVELRYNTNFMLLQYKDLHIFEFWNKFKKVVVGASIDGYEDRLEYIRKDSSWKQIVSNRQQMMQACPNVEFFVNFTLSVFNFNIMHKFHRMWIDNSFIKPGDFNINFLTYPLHYKVNVAPMSMRMQVVKEYENHIDWMMNQGIKNDVLYARWNSAVNFLKQEEFDPVQQRRFRELTKQLDEIRDESFVKTFLELKEIYE